MRTPSGVGLALLCLAALPAPARAYLIDANDARAAPPGTFEVELQPFGYLFFEDEGQGQTELVIPSLQVYLGLEDRLDVLFLSRGFIPVPMDGDDPAVERRFRLAEQMLAFRYVLVEGAYSDEADRGLQGPSVVLQWGALLPGFAAEEHLGVTFAVLVSELTDLGTFHGNAWVNYTEAGTVNVFLAAVVEGPPAWPLRPTVEVWLDHDTEDGSLLSGLLGFLSDLGDELTLQAGVRLAGWEGYLEVEARVSSFFAFDLR